MSKDQRPLHHAMFWDRDKYGSVICILCPNSCIIPDGETGHCGVRKNIDGELFAIGYGRLSSLALDPVEKKPLYHFFPGKNVLSEGGFGCNLRCPFCQNHEISTDYGGRLAAAQVIPPDILVESALEAGKDNNIGLAHTYNEPFVNYEYAFDCAVLARRKRLMNVLVTNGYVSREPLQSLLPHIHAVNIDLKGFTEGFYRKLGGSLEDVKRTIELCVKTGRVRVEITTLVIPGENEDHVEPIAEWLSGLNPKIPLHISRFFPRHKYADKKATPPETVLRLCEAAGKHLKYVYAGNM